MSRESDTEIALKVDWTADFIHVVKAAVRGVSVISGGARSGIDGGCIVNLVAGKLGDEVEQTGDIYQVCSYDTVVGCSHVSLVY